MIKYLLYLSKASSHIETNVEHRSIVERSYPTLGYTQSVASLTQSGRRNVVSILTERVREILCIGWLHAPAVLKIWSVMSQDPLTQCDPSSNGDPFDPWPSDPLPFQWNTTQSPNVLWNIVNSQIDGSERLNSCSLFHPKTARESVKESCLK